MKQRFLHAPLLVAPFALALLALPAARAQQASPDASNTLALSTQPPTPISSSLDMAATDLPDAPQAQNTSATPADPSQQEPENHQDKQTTRILGILPNFRAISANQHLPPQSVKDKFVTATQDSFDYSAFPVPLFVATLNYERNSVPQFGTGGGAYGQYVWHSLVDQTIENYMVEFVVPAATHEDTRYYTLGHGGFAKRAGYSLGHVFVTRADDGHNTFNAGEIVGSGASAAVSSLYYPSQQRDLSDIGSSWALDIGLDAFGFFVKEFWPEVNHFLFHGKKDFQEPSAPAAPKQ